MLRAELRVEGKDVAPEAVPLGDLLYLLEGWNRALMVQAHYLQTQAEGPAQAEDLQLRLLAVAPGSLALTLGLPHPRLREALHLLHRELRQPSGTTRYLVRKALDALEKVQARLRARSWRTRLRVAGEQWEIILTGDTPLPQPERLTQYATLYGELVRIGGDDPPTASLRLPDGTLVHVRVSRARGKGTRLAKELARHLYEWVGLRGRMEVRLPEHEIVHMVVDDILTYQPAPDVDTLIRELREVSPSLGRYRSAEDFLNAASMPPS